MENSKQAKSTLWQDIKKYWIIFLLFGIISAIISAGVSTFVSTKISESMKGPPCRIDFVKERFPMTKSTFFNLQYLVINLRDKDILLEGLDNYCYWQTKEEKSSQKEDTTKDEIIIEQPITKEIPAPKELDNLPASKSEIKSAFNCRSPDQEGLYKIKIVVRTTSGSCEGDILMEVKK